MPRASARVFRPSAVLLALIASAGIACNGATSEPEPAEGAELEVGASPALDPATAAELRGVGFDDRELQAVADSVWMSKVLGVKSYVTEINEGWFRDGASFVRRESHGKGQGCLRAKFEVTTRANVGIFREGASYPAWIRLSNGGAYQRDDKGTHISRGWGIKLLGVEGTPTGTQDFLFITSPRFFIHDITHYPGFLKSSGNGRLGFGLNFLFNMSWEEKEVIIHRMRLKVANLLESPGYSAVPYAYGAEPVKYAIARCDAGAPPSSPESREPPPGSSEDYLEEAMHTTLRTSPHDSGVCYGFYIQRPRRNDSIDNPTSAWEGAFEQVAKITIPYGQHRGGVADYRANEAECERMAFDPFHTTEASMPIGKTNWTRKIVYAALADFRRTELPKIVERWKRDPNDRSLREEYRRELKKLREPSAAIPNVADTSEPEIDDGFRTLGIVR